MDAGRGGGGGRDLPGEKGELADEVLQKDIVQMDVVVEVERAVGVHAVEAVVGHDTIFEAVGEQVCVDEV